MDRVDAVDTVDKVDIVDKWTLWTTEHICPQCPQCPFCPPCSQRRLENSLRMGAGHRIITRRRRQLTEAENPELFNVDVGAEPRPRSFTPAEMLTCDACLRANPPTRGQCLYCGAQLPVTTTSRTPELQEQTAAPGSHEGFYVLAASRDIAGVDDSSLETLATRLEIKATDLRGALRAEGDLPFCHLKTREQAEELADEIRQTGIQTSIISGEDLKSASAGKKIRALEFSDDGLSGLTVTSGEHIYTPWPDLILMVVGRLLTTNIEDVAQQKRRGQKPLDHREVSHDETMLDLYSRSSETASRIIAASFDFSCLGERKGMTAFENFTTLIDVLRERAANLVVNESYVAARTVLAKVWPLASSTRGGGWRRAGAGKLEVSTVTTIDNEAQFNNYSRLLQVLRMRELAAR